LDRRTENEKEHPSANPEAAWERPTVEIKREKTDQNTSLCRSAVERTNM
jgi:hypothetical protein